MNPQDSVKITIHTQRRRDGGLRAWSPDVSGLVLSHSDPQKVMADIIPAVETIMADVLGYPVQASQLVPVRERAGLTLRRPSFGRRFHAMVDRVAITHMNVLEYVATPAPCLA